MTKIKDETAQRLAKLIRLLDSDNDGEALAAARAIRTTLRNEKLDFHLLAELIESGGRTEQRMPAPRPSPAMQEYDQDDFRHMAEYCASRIQLVNHREAVFINDMLEWLHWRMPTERQAVWLCSIYRWLGGI